MKLPVKPCTLALCLLPTILAAQIAPDAATRLAAVEAAAKVCPERRR